MTEAAPASNYFDRLLERAVLGGRTAREARADAFEAYLEGKPTDVRKRKLSRADRDAVFWSSAAVVACDSHDWQAEPMRLALARYLGQDRVTADGLLMRLARQAPQAVEFAVRRSALVLRPASPRRKDLQQCAEAGSELAELCAALDIFSDAHALRLNELERCQAAFASTSAIELLTWASLYAFEYLVPHSVEGRPAIESQDLDVERVWDAINALLLWKLKTQDSAALRLDEASIAVAILPILKPLLFAEQPQQMAAALDRLVQFRALIEAQLELQEFLSRSIDAFCYDDAIRFERRGVRLEIVEQDPSARDGWQRDTRRLQRLHGYWLCRAIDAFAESEVVSQRIGRPENQDNNRLAWIRALRTRMRLQEVYGVADRVTGEGGREVDLFQALLTVELTSVFFLRDFLAAFAQIAQAGDHWLSALGQLVVKGLADGLQNRFPLTWSDRAAKVKRLTGWTVTPSLPQGSAAMAEAILDFWSYDMVALAERLQRDESGLEPRLFERPVLRFGGAFVQLPWIAGLQNNSSAAINNLRRLGARRGEARAETQRIEAGLARRLEERGFRVLLNWLPPAEMREAGEVDVLAARDGLVLLLELKSTFLRESVRDAWLHTSTTLRRAGRQLVRKRAAVLSALTVDVALCESLGLAATSAVHPVHTWIVDTSIEGDHCSFEGCLKLSVEEVLIALRDDRHLLDESQALLEGGSGVGALPLTAGSAPQERDTLYRHGFTASRFVEVIETQAVWGSD